VLTLDTDSAALASTANHSLQQPSRLCAAFRARDRLKLYLSLLQAIACIRSHARASRKVRLACSQLRVAAPRERQRRTTLVRADSHQPGTRGSVQAL